MGVWPAGRTPMVGQEACSDRDAVELTEPRNRDLDTARHLGELDSEPVTARSTWLSPA